MRVDITNVCKEEEWERGSSEGGERWGREMMGITDSPYHACQAVIWSKSIAVVYRLDLNNLRVMLESDKYTVVLQLLGATCLS